MRSLAGVLIVIASLLAASHAGATLRAGAASVSLHVPAGTPLAGYGARERRLPFPDLLGRYPHAFWFRPHDGVLDAPSARALVLEGDERLIWVTVDLVAVDAAFTRAVADRVGVAGTSRLIVSASHTHSGPGAFMDVAVLGLLSADRFDGVVRKALLESVVDAVQRAERAMTPARVGSLPVRVPGLTSGRLGRPVDSELVVLKVVAESGAPIAVVWNYAIHGTMLPPKNLSLSGDVMGMASRRIEQELKIPALFVNGAVGDVSPEHHGYPAAQETARTLALTVRGAWVLATALDTTLVTASTRVALPSPRVSVHNCLGAWAPRALTVPLGFMLPAETELVAAAVGNTAWVTLPGELQSSLGVEVKRTTEWKRTLVAGVSNDYLGYFMSRADYDRPSYVSCASLYGPDAGEEIARAAADLLRTLHQRVGRARTSR